MTNYLYDSNFPYVVTWGGYQAARFKDRENADAYARETVGQVVDTAPKVYKEGFYRHANSGVYYYDGEGNWTDVVEGYQSVSNIYVEALELTRLVPAHDNEG